MYRLGRKAPQYTPQHMRAALAAKTAFDQLGAPPGESPDWTAAVKQSWGMMLNDQLGCCTAADTGHALMLRTANVGRIIVPTDTDILNYYIATSGYNPKDPSTDQGAMETTVCQYNIDTGFLGHKSAMTAPVMGIDQIKWGINLGGSVRLGVNLPSIANDQFNAGIPWTVVPGSAIEGGHDMLAVRYDGNYMYVITWGGIASLTWDWVKTYLEEAHVELFPDWIRSQGTAPSGLDLAQLEQDLRG